MVAPDLDGPYYMQSIPYIRFEDVNGTCSVTISFDGHTIEETYTPDSQGDVYVRDLPRLLADYVDGFNPDTLNAGQVIRRDKSYYVTVTCRDASDSATAWFTFVPCREHMPFDTEEIIFYSRYKERRVGMNELFFISLDGGFQFQVSLLHDGGETNHSFSSPGSGINTFVLSAAYIASVCGVPKDSLIKATFTIGSTGSPSDKMIVLFDRYNKKTCTNVIYDNLFYLPESWCFTGNQSENVSMNKSLVTINDTLVSVDNDTHNEYTINSGPLTDDAFMSLCDIPRADHVAILEPDGSLTPVVLLDLQASHNRPKKAPSSVTLTLRDAHKAATTFSRTQRATHGLFSRSYTETFD